MEIISSPVGAKAQVTLPKKVREILGINGKGDLVGFSIKGKTVTLTKAKVVPAEEEYTPQDISKLILLAHDKDAKTFKDGEEFLKYHRKLSGL